MNNKWYMCIYCVYTVVVCSSANDPRWALFIKQGVGKMNGKFTAVSKRGAACDDGGASFLSRASHRDDRINTNTLNFSMKNDPCRISNDYLASLGSPV